MEPCAVALDNEMQRRDEDVGYVPTDLLVNDVGQFAVVKGNHDRRFKRRELVGRP